MKKYYRCPYPDSYYTVEGDVVTYYAPQCPGGSKTDDTAADMERLAKRTPTHERLCHEITEEQARGARARLLDVVAKVDKIDAERKALEASRLVFA